MFDNAINRAIDEVAREMTAGEPSADLRARVTARIDAAGNMGAQRVQPGGRAWRLAFASAAFAAVAIVLLAVFAYRENRPIVRGPGPSGAGLSAGHPLTADSARQGRPTESAGRPGADVPGAIEPARSVPARHRLAITPSPIDQLAPPRIDVAPLAIDDLDAPPLDVPPLESIAPIEVAPLGQGEQR